MQLNCKVIKKWQTPHFYIFFPFFRVIPPILEKFLVPTQVTQFFQGSTFPPLITMYIEQFSKINRKNIEIFANVPPLQLYKIVFGEVKNSFIGNILGLGD